MTRVMPKPIMKIFLGDVEVSTGENITYTKIFSAPKERSESVAKPRLLRCRKMLAL